MSCAIVFVFLMCSLFVPNLSCIHWVHLKDPTSLFLLLFFLSLSASLCQYHLLRLDWSMCVSALIYVNEQRCNWVESVWKEFCWSKFHFMNKSNIMEARSGPLWNRKPTHSLTQVHSCDGVWQRLTDGSFGCHVFNEGAPNLTNLTRYPGEWQLASILSGPFEVIL